MPLAAMQMMQMSNCITKIPKRKETRGNGGQSQQNWSALLKFQTASTNFDSAYNHDSNRVFMSIWHYNRQDKLVIKASVYNCSKNL